MNLLPECILCEIIEYLPSNEIFRHIILISKLFHRIITTTPFLTGNVIKHKVNSHKALRLSYSHSKSILESLISPCVLEFKGFGTTGGFDNNNPIYWVGNLYDDNSSFYCSRDNKNNFNTSGVLKITQTEDQHKPSYDYIYSLLNKSMTLSSSIYPRYKSSQPLSSCHIESFLSLYNNHRGALIRILSQEIEESEEAISEALAKAVKEIKCKKIICKDLKRRSEDEYVMIEGIDYKAADEGVNLGVVRAVEVSREGGFTCPLETFIVFVSERYVDIEDEEFLRYNNIEDYSELVKRFAGQVEKLVKNEDGSCFARFKASKSELKPLVWGKFNERQVTVMKMKLYRNVSGNYLYMKMISPDNRMQEMNDTHEFTNIDCNYLIAYGSIINLASQT